MQRTKLYFMLLWLLLFLWLLLVWCALRGVLPGELCGVRSCIPTCVLLAYAQHYPVSVLSGVCGVAFCMYTQTCAA